MEVFSVKLAIVFGVNYMQNILTSVPSIAPIAEASVVGIESSFTDSIASELRFPRI